MLDNQDPSRVRVPHPPRPANFVLIQRQEILEHAEADKRVLDAR